MSAVPRIVSIIEGGGDEDAVPILIRRIAADIGLYVDAPRGIRTSRDRFPRFTSERENRMRIAQIDAGTSGGILVLLDADCEPECRHGEPKCLLGDELLEAIRPLAAGLPVGVVLAHWEFESWFIAAAESLVERGDLKPGTQAPRNPEAVQGAKEWLRSHMLNRPTYSPTADQPRLTAQFDMQQARQRSPSFDWCYREIERLIRAVTQAAEAANTPSGRL